MARAASSRSCWSDARACSGSAAFRTSALKCRSGACSPALRQIAAAHARAAVTPTGRVPATWTAGAPDGRALRSAWRARSRSSASRAVSASACALANCDAKMPSLVAVPTEAPSPPAAFTGFGSEVGSGAVAGELLAATFAAPSGSLPGVMGADIGIPPLLACAAMAADVAASAPSTTMETSRIFARTTRSGPVNSRPLTVTAWPCSICRVLITSAPIDACHLWPFLDRASTFSAIGPSP